ncbi:unnamed protein product [Darwinula stevensoni]|uniref:Uncharacterized protein n=1 Tax=Darwinula stevensoni TaxID=69355 RepID=A0A7R8X8V6_9CRUS|nr:unnamed protein product [Darwinula stevensoni]CAG0889085.1 unnamed protein product [Darwinula stevensoni]
MRSRDRHGDSTSMSEQDDGTRTTEAHPNKIYIMPKSVIKKLLRMKVLSPLCDYSRAEDGKIGIDGKEHPYLISLRWETMSNDLTGLAPGEYVPSLTVADYAFTDTLLKGVKQQQKTRFIKNFGVTEEDLPSGDHDVFGTGISGSSIIGLFFQIKGTISGVNPKGILDNMAIATKQLEKDLNIFRTMCGEFLNPIVKLAGFVAFPMLSRSDIQKRIKCINCRTRILVFEDLAKPRSFRRFLARQGIVLEKYYPDPESHIMKTFKNIFDLYVCAASAVDLPRNLHQLFNKSEEQMEKMLVLLTPQQRKLVMTKSKFIFLSGGSGTGKTFVLKKRALELAAEGEVLVINIAGGLLTEEFRHDFEGIHKKLLAHIQQNEASSGLTLQAKSLQTSSMPAAIVWGSKIVYLNHKCSGRHWGYLCNEEERCESIEPVLPFLLLFALSRAGGCDITEMEPNATEGDVIYVLFSDDDLLASLQSQVYKRLGENLRTKFLHCRDFWGCEASSVISVNVDDSFLLEVLSRGRIQLTLVDTTPNHKDLWTAMADEGRTDDCPVIFPEWPKDHVMDLQTLLRMEGQVHFLQEGFKVEAECKECVKSSYLARLQSYERRGNLDIRKHLNIYSGNRAKSLDKTPWKDAADKYLAEHYPEAYTKAYSLPEGYILSKQAFNESRSRAQKGKDVGISGRVATALVFTRLKDALKEVPSLTLAGYLFVDTFLKGIKQEQKDKFVKEHGLSQEDLTPGCHDVFGTVISGDEVLVLFFQIRVATNSKTVNGPLARMAKQLRRDFSIFQTMCGEFLSTNVKLAGFMAFPTLSEFDLRKYIKCRECRARILTSTDLSSMRSFRRFLRRHGILLKKSWDPKSPTMESFKNIFDFYVCAASSLNLPRSPVQLITQSKQQMRRMQESLTPQETELVMSQSEFIFMYGGCGTGKTFLLKKRALELAKSDEVLVINFSGGQLTREFRCEFEGSHIVVLDGKEKDIPEDFNGLCHFLQAEGMGKHVLLDEVPITFGIRGCLNVTRLSQHWERICCLRGHIKSLTLAFCTFHSTYTRDIDLQCLQVPGVCMVMLDAMKKKTRYVTDLIFALDDYSRKKFFCFEPSIIHTDFGHSKDELLPTSCTIPPCHILHDICWSQSICEIVRSSYVIVKLLQKHSIKLEKVPFLVVDSMERRNYLVNIFPCIHDISVVFFDENGTAWVKACTSSGFAIVIVTDDQFLGYHPDNVIIILDLPQCKWRNYTRIISSCHDNITIVMERESLHMGKYSFLKLNHEDIEENEEIKGKLEIAQQIPQVEIAHVDEKTCRLIQFPLTLDGKGLPLASSPPRCTVIFGPPSSGKRTILSYKVALSYLDTCPEFSKVVRSDVSSPQGIFANGWVKRLKEEYPNSTIHVHVDDYSIQASDTEEEIRMWRRALEDFQNGDQNMTVTIVFQSHARNGLCIDIDELRSFLQSHSWVNVVTLPISTWTVPSYTSPQLLTHISTNEAKLPSRRERRSLNTASIPSALVFGPKPKYFKYKCTGRHLNFSCKGQMYCELLLGVLVCFRSILNQEMDQDPMHVLVSDETLMVTLQNCAQNESREIIFLHPREFRGSTADSIVIANVDDMWMMESVSRSAIYLAIIDTSPGHNQIWDTLEEEGLLDVLEITTDRMQIDQETIFMLNEKDEFLKDTSCESPQRISNEFNASGMMC